MRVSMADLLAGCCVITVTTSSCLLPCVVEAQNKKRESRSVIHPSQGGGGGGRGRRGRRGRMGEDGEDGGGGGGLGEMPEEKPATTERSSGCLTV